MDKGSIGMPPKSDRRWAAFADHCNGCFDCDSNYVGLPDGVGLCSEGKGLLREWQGSSNYRGAVDGTVAQ